MLYFYLRPHVIPDQDRGSLNTGLTFPSRRRRHYLLTPLGAIMALKPGGTEMLHGRKIRCVVSPGFKETILGRAKFHLEFNYQEREALEMALLAILEGLDDD